MINTYTHIHTHNLEAQKSATQICGETYLNSKNLELSFEIRHSGEILQTGRRRIPDYTDETMKLNELPPTAFKLRLVIFKSFSLESRQVSGV